MGIFNIIKIAICAKTLINKEFELYDGINPQYMLASREDSLFFINEKNAKIQKANSVFTIQNNTLKLGNKSICSDGLSGKVLRLCEYSSMYPIWKLVPVPNEYEMYELRTADGKRCAVYGPTEDEERIVTIDSCQSHSIKFKLLEFDEYLTKSYDERMTDGIRFWPTSKMGGWPDTPGLNGRYNPIIPEKITMNV